jgi:mono/diheme cytochrome c family protein
MQTRSVFWNMFVVLVVAVGLLAACGGPEATETPEETQPTVPPTAAPQEEQEQPAAPPTEAPPEEEPTTPPTEAPQEEEPAAQPAGGDGMALLEERCTECHGLERTTSKQKTREEWEQTVVRMVSKGAQLNEEEQAILITYLAENYGP